MRVVFEARELDDGLWDVALTPTDAQRLSGTPAVAGEKSVILASDAAFDANTSVLSVELTALIAVVIGRGDRALIVAADEDHGASTHVATCSEEDADFDARRFPGDREFLEETSKLPRDAEIAIRRLLARIRKREPGSMKRGSRRNFSNQPDNFWYAIVQPTKGNVSITVRGRPELFEPSQLSLKVDRPGYTRFYLSGPDEVDEAFRIVSASRRKR